MKIPVSEKPFVKTNQFSQPRMDVKSVLCFYHGKFPKITRPDKDVTLSHRLFPNAKLYIRCKSDDEQTRVYLTTLFNGKCQIELIPDALDCSKIPAEVLFLQQDCWLFFGGVIEKGCLQNALIMQKWTKEAYIFYNDESLGALASLWEIMKLRKYSGQFMNRNQSAYIQVKEKKDWSQVHVLANENRLCNWMTERVSDDLKQKGIQCDYLSDIILYDLKQPLITSRPKCITNTCGIFIGSFHQTRAKAWNKIFPEPIPYFQIDVFGNGSDKLKSYTGSGEYISNAESLKKFPNYQWSIYLGKGTPSLYLGATFFEPLLNYCPIFVWTGTDPDKKLFPGLDCYFTTKEDLKNLVWKWFYDLNETRDLWHHQINCIFKD